MEARYSQHGHLFGVEFNLESKPSIDAFERTHTGTLKIYSDILKELNRKAIVSVKNPETGEQLSAVEANSMDELNTGTNIELADADDVGSAGHRLEITIDYFSSETVSIWVPTNELTNTYLVLLSNSSNRKKTIEDKLSQTLDDSGFTRNARKKTDTMFGFETYSEILASLYSLGSYPNVNQAKSLEKRLLRSTGTYAVDNYDEFLNMLETYSSHSGLDTVSTEEVIQEHLYNRWKAEDWEPEEGQPPTPKEVKRITEIAGFAEIQDKLSDETLVHFLVIKELSEGSNNISNILENLNRESSLSIDTNLFDRVTIDAQPHTEPLIKRQKPDVARFLYYKANKCDSVEMSKNKEASSLYAMSSKLFSNSDSTDSHWAPLAQIHSHRLFGIGFKVNNTDKAFNYFSEPLRIYGNNSETIPSPSMGYAGSCLVNAGKSLVRSIYQNGDVERVIKKFESLLGLAPPLSELGGGWQDSVEVVESQKRIAEAHMYSIEGNIKKAKDSIYNIPEDIDLQKGNIEIRILGLYKLSSKALVNEANGNYSESSRQLSLAAEQADDDEIETRLIQRAKAAELKSVLSGLDFLDSAPDPDMQLSNSVQAVPELEKMTTLLHMVEEYHGSSQVNISKLADTVGSLETTDYICKGILQFNNDYSGPLSSIIMKQRDNPTIDSSIVYESVEHTMSLGSVSPPEPNSHPVGSASDGGTEQINSNVETEVDRDYQTTSRIRRDPSFASKVKEAYDDRCGICGTRRRSPDGGTEVEAAHIKPVNDDGPDIVQNGIALCRLHHWAFDNGWLTIDTDYTILVRDAPDVDGYDEFSQLQGNRLHLPDDDDLTPSKQFISYHRENSGISR